jgi:hypothetical protein
MRRCLLYKIVERQVKSWGPGDRIRIFGFLRDPGRSKRELRALDVAPEISGRTETGIQDRRRIR